MNKPKSITSEKILIKEYDCRPDSKCMTAKEFIKFKKENDTLCKTEWYLAEEMDVYLKYKNEKLTELQLKWKRDSKLVDSFLEKIGITNIDVVKGTMDIAIPNAITYEKLLEKKDAEWLGKIEKVLEQATRHKRGTKEQQYLITDLEIIEKLLLEDKKNG